MKGLTKAAQWARADVYQKFVAAYLRPLGWGVEEIGKKNKDRDPDIGDLLLTRNGRMVTMDVKENGNWTSNPGRGDWFPFSTVILTSTDQYHPEWSYCIVATDLHAMAFVNPARVPEDGFERSTHGHPAGYTYKTIEVKTEFMSPVLMHLSGRTIL